MIVDFQRSFIRWNTTNGSYGRFNVEAYLNFNNTHWVLGSEVMACDVYGKGPLFKDPAFAFQPLFSKDECKIFRTYSLEEKTDHTLFKASEQFKSHSIDILEIENYSEIDFAMELNSVKQYQCIVSAKDYSLQFPIKHLNIRESDKEFQVETGPIAFPNNNSISTGYIAFNKLSAFEILLFDSIKQIKTNKIITEKKCEIKIISKL